MQQLLYVFGTGSAQARRCYNTCFALRKGDGYFMVDAGGGNGILRILDEMAVPLEQIRALFVTHAHTDHILGVVWIVRMVAAAMRAGRHTGMLDLYCHAGLTDTILQLCRLTVQARFCEMIGRQIFLHPLEDGDCVEILENPYRFFDIHSPDTTQLGFTTTLDNGRTLCFCGDEPLHTVCYEQARGMDWLLHEAFCRYADRERYQPYEKYHRTVVEACQTAEKLGVKRLLLWHSEDEHLPERCQLYTEEGRPFFSGEIYVPADGEIIEL